MPESVLEFKAKDGAWYAGTATFEGPFLRVHFEHFPEDEDERWLPTKFKASQDVKKMIRPASQPMQDYHCRSLQRGIFLCVACRQQHSEYFAYYDAKLHQIQRFPHTNDEDGQECCMCKFEVEWLGGPLVQKRHFVTCGDICLKSHGDIEDDPVIREYLAEVNRCKISIRESVSEKDILSAPQKRKALSSPDESREHPSSANCQQFVSDNDFNGFDTSLQCGESSDQTRDYSNKKEEHIEGQSMLKSCKSTLHMKSCEPKVASQRLPELFQAGKKPVNVIEIDSDKEEDCKPLSISSLIQTDAIDDVSANKSVPGLDFSKGIPNKESPSLDDGCSTHHEFSENSKEQLFTCSQGAPACSHAPWPRHCHIGGSCQYETMGLIPIDPFHLTHVLTHSMHSHINMKTASKCTRSDNVCTQSATSQICSQIACCCRADGSAHIQFYGGSGNIKNMSRCQKANGRNWSLKGGKGLTRTHFLLVENIEKDVVPFKALKVIRRVTSDAITIYIWPSLDYETTRKGYICFQDFEAAEAAFQKLSAENLFIVSSKGRPWVISKPHLQELDWSQMCSVSATVAQRIEEIEEDNKSQGGEFIIVHKGMERYNIVRNKQKLFLEQQKKLQLYFQQFMVEEREVEAITRSFI